MPPRKYTDALIGRAAVLREEGKSIRAIAERLGMSRGAVYWHCLRLGADSPNVRNNVLVTQGPLVIERGNHRVRRFTPEEDRILIEMDLAGARVSEMARRLNRPHNSGTGRLMTIARHEERVFKALGERR